MWRHVCASNVFLYLDQTGSILKQMSELKTNSTSGYGRFFATTIQSGVIPERESCLSRYGNTPWCFWTLIKRKVLFKHSLLLSKTTVGIEWLLWNHIRVGEGFKRKVYRSIRELEKHRIQKVYDCWTQLTAGAPSAYYVVFSAPPTHTHNTDDSNNYILEFAARNHFNKQHNNIILTSYFQLCDFSR